MRELAGEQTSGLAPALLWEEWRGGPAVHCFLCAHHCRVDPGERGVCGVRENRGGSLFTLVYECAVSASADPIEKKPLYHFLPGTRSLSVATMGCNFSCSFCQNADISQKPRETGEIWGAILPAEDVAEKAVDMGCRSVAYTYTEPTIYFEYALECARAVAEKGLKNVFVTNGYMTREALDTIGGDLHAANVDLKSFSDQFYREYVGARLKPVLDSIRRLVARGVWVEVTTLLIPGINDGQEEMRRIGRFIASVGRHIPWHVSRFSPGYKMAGIPPTPVRTVERALEIGREEGLEYVYAGNVPGHSSESTFCPSCGFTLVARRGYVVDAVQLDQGRCPGCGRIPELVIEEEGGCS